jgi:hypothetical protein
MSTFRRLLSHDSERRLRVWLRIEEDGGMAFEHEQYGLESILEANQEYMKENPRNVHVGNTQKWGVKVAEIPVHIWMRLKDEGIAGDPKALRKWLSDPDNRFFRTWQGKL